MSHDSPSTKIQLQQQAHVSLWQTADGLHRSLREALEPYGLSEPQFNVLRILRGAGGDGLPCKEVGARMVTRVPDVTRIMDRLEQAGLMERSRDNDDRRVVKAQITSEGRKLLRRVDPRVAEEHAAAFDGWSAAELRRFLDLLEEVHLRD
jgi:MarR family transcriptional regulator, organic hydroperoxide resistance regulator